MDKINNIGVSRLMTSVYDFDGFTEQEIWCRIAQKINIIIDHFNYIDKKLEHEKEYTKNQFNYLLNDGLDKSITKEITKRLDNGSLNTVINKAIFKEINDNIDALNSKITDIIKRVEVLEKTNKGGI